MFLTSVLDRAFFSAILLIISIVFLVYIWHFSYLLIVSFWRSILLVIFLTIFI